MTCSTTRNPIYGWMAFSSMPMPDSIAMFLRGILREKEIIANIYINKRRENADDIFVDDELYAERYSIERTNAWMDSFRTLLNRFSSGMFWNYLVFAVLLLKKILRKQKV